MKKILLFSFLMINIAFEANAQYDFVAKKIIPNGHLKIKTLKNKFITNQRSNIYYSKLSNPKFPLEYIDDGNCGKFVIKNKTFPLKDFFETELACDLDLTAYKVYQFRFKRHQYYALECINKGSRTSFILIHLFEVGKQSIYYYPLWSRYGSINCIGDFNKDGNLDFLKIRNNEDQTGKDTFKATIMSLNHSQHIFKDLNNSEAWYFRKTYINDNLIDIKMLK